MARNDQQLSAPERLRAEHDLSEFDCGEPTLDDWLRRRALHNEESGASRTYVVRAGHQVAGYYALAVGAVAHVEAAGRVRRNMPDPVPVMIIGRLAVHKDFQGRRIGRSAPRRRIANVAGGGDCRNWAILVHAISERARQFYEECGFIPSPMDPMTLMVTVAEAAKAFIEKNAR